MRRGKIYKKKQHKCYEIQNEQSSTCDTQMYALYLFKFQCITRICLCHSFGVSCGGREPRATCRFCLFPFNITTVNVYGSCNQLCCSETPFFSSSFFLDKIKRRVNAANKNVCAKIKPNSFLVNAPMCLRER